jgi:hypothetical protein
MPLPPDPRRRVSRVRIILGALLAGATSVVLVSRAAEKPDAANDTDHARSVHAFRQVASVLRHPRCINCHTVTNFPRQGNERRRHDMNVVRGSDDHGAPAMRCYSCHQHVNQQNGVPGAPNWGLAPLSMAWEGLDDHQLAEMLKNPEKNGHRSLEQIFEHNVHDELVGWGWQPGAGRETPPLTREEFGKALREWISTGAVSPDSK